MLWEPFSDIESNIFQPALVTCDQSGGFNRSRFCLALLIDLVPDDLAVFAVRNLQIAVPAYLHPYLQRCFVPTKFISYITKQHTQTCLRIHMQITFVCWCHNALIFKRMSIFALKIYQSTFLLHKI